MPNPTTDREAKKWKKAGKNDMSRKSFDVQPMMSKQNQ
jgi:hypothetical protein